MVLFCLPVLIFVSGCDLADDVADMMFSSQNSAEELEYSAGKNVQNYEYSHKVLVTISDHNDDTLNLNDGFGNYNDYGLKNHSILSGYFDKVAWYDYKLFICMDDKYYCFDINSYSVPDTATTPTDSSGEVLYDEITPEYELKEYSEKDMEKLYPEYNSFDWYGH
ncbi:MAG: hypothetical protein ACI4RL_01105 [Ruminococcus sp.]